MVLVAAAAVVQMEVQDQTLFFPQSHRMAVAMAHGTNKRVAMEALAAVHRGLRLQEVVVAARQRQIKALTEDPQDNILVLVAVGRVQLVNHLLGAVQMVKAVQELHLQFLVLV